MKLSVAIASSLSALAAAGPVPAAEAEATKVFDTRAECAVNAEVIDLFIEDGMSRRVIRHSAEGTDEDYLNDIFCGYFKQGTCHYPCCGEWFNPQCFIDDDGHRIVHVSNFRGPVGDNAFHDCMQQNLDHWVKDTGCTTG